MKKVETEILVLGSGLAGAAAALNANKAGKKVAVLSRDGGGSAMSSGALDIAGDILAVPGQPESWCHEIGRNLEQIMLRNPAHPYHLLGDSRGQVQDRIKAAFDLVFPADDGFIKGGFEANRLVFNQLGTFKATALVQDRMLTFDDLLEADSAGLFAFSGLLDFDADFFRTNFEYWCGRLAAKTKVQAIKLSLGSEPAKSSLEWARAIEQEPDAVLGKLIAAAKTISARLLILPPILPGSCRARILAALEKETGKKVCELLALPPSVPGTRFSQYLEAGISRAGVSKILGKAVGFSAENKKLISVSAADGREPFQIFAKNFVLASGSFLAGGLAKAGGFREQIFGLDTFQQGRPCANIFTEKLTSPVITDPHPVFSIGLKVDAEQRPLSREGHVVFENLFAAGSILSGANYISDSTGAGTALATGFRAGEQAAKS